MTSIGTPDIHMIHRLWRSNGGQNLAGPGCYAARRSGCLKTELFRRQALLSLASSPGALPVPLGQGGK